jgi:hypothetical protein
MPNARFVMTFPITQPVYLVTRAVLAGREEPLRGYAVAGSLGDESSPSSAGQTFYLIVDDSGSIPPQWVSTVDVASASVRPPL